MRIRFLLYILLIVLSLPASAQKRRRVQPPLPQPTPEEQERQAKIERMTAATEKVMFIDSIVVKKADFLNHYKLNPETGSFKKAKEFASTQHLYNGYAYVNEIGTKCFFSKAESDTTTNLYTCESVSNVWSTPEKVAGINDDMRFSLVDYPFMMGDGQTFYFAAKGGEGLGGYDIYTTTYDSETHRFLRPANIGMPFNSEANDYMYVIDEYNNLGWFATDRNHSNDSVCIYVFIPSAIRQNYEPDVYTSEQIAHFASIHAIADTWDNPRQLREAQARLYKSRTRQPQKLHEFVFIINDDIVYHQLSDFQAKDNVQRHQQLTSLRSRWQSLSRSLDTMRQSFTTTNPKKRQTLVSEILGSEHELYTLNRQISDMEKSIRNKELLLITKK